MSRNRIKNSQSLHWMGVVKWVLIAGLLAVLGLSYMLCKNQNLHLAEETRRLEVQLDGIEKRNEQLTYDLESMKSPSRLVKRLAQMHSGLVRISDGTLAVEQMNNQEIRARLMQMGTLPQGGLNPDVAQAVPDSSSP
jgi:hypothetical protein